MIDHACSSGAHEYGDCEVSLLERSSIDRTRVRGPRQVTDAYLRALATAHGGRFVTFDDSVPLAAATKATREHLTVL